MVRRVRSISIAIAIVLASSLVSGQQPKRSREPYIPALLPAEQKWVVTLPAPPSAAAAMNDDLIFIPGQVKPSEDGEDPNQSNLQSTAVLTALERETGKTRWSYQVASGQPPVLHGGVVIVAAGREIHGIGAADGKRQWMTTVARPVRAPMLVRGRLLIALLEGDDLVAVDVDSQQVAWRRAIGESGPVLFTANDEAIFLSTAASRVVRVDLADGAYAWERQLEGELSEPTVDRNRVFVGSNATLGSLWSLNADSGKEEWRYGGRNARIFGGAVVGTALHRDTLYVVSKDNFVRALNRGRGNQVWKVAVSRPVFAPLVLQQTVMVTGLTPTLAAFDSAGTARGTWAAPPNAVLQGPPLVDEPSPYRVSIIVVLRDGQVIALRPAEMLFKEAAPTPIKTLPGRALPREAMR